MSMLLGSLTAEEREKFVRLQWIANQAMEGLTSGIHRSPHLGFSIEFKEHRAYVPGDDLRSVDWKLFGKTDRLYIRQFEDETNLRVHLLLDQSGSMRYGVKSTRGEKTPSSSGKHEYAVQFAACLAYLFVRQHDAVGLALFDQQLRGYLPPRSRPNHLQHVLAMLVQSHCGGETDLSSVLDELASKIRRRGVVIVLSDGFDKPESLVRSLTNLRAKHNEVVLIQILHPDELTFPFRGRTQFESLEIAGESRLLDAVAIRASYLRRLEAFQQQLADGCQRNRIRRITCTTDQPPSAVLATLLEQREAH